MLDLSRILLTNVRISGLGGVGFFRGPALADIMGLGEREPSTLRRHGWSLSRLPDLNHADESGRNSDGMIRDGHRRAAAIWGEWGQILKLAPFCSGPIH